MQNRRIKEFFIAVVILLTFNNISFSQDTDALGTFTPYSIFGLGDINKGGTAFNKAMGGTGIAIRENRLINLVNPAAISYRDTLSFMLDFGVTQSGHYSKSDNKSSAYNVFNMHHVALTFPIYKKSAFVAGIMPYSNIGYKFDTVETRPEIINELGYIRYQKYGTGGITKSFMGASFVFLDKFSFGAEGIYYFGTIDKYSNANFITNPNYRAINTGIDHTISSFSGKLGLQYSTKVKNDLDLTVGATWLIGSKLGGDFSRYSYAYGSRGNIDTVYSSTVNETFLEIPNEYGIGFSLRKKDKWLITADYIRQDWSDVDFLPTPGVDFRTAASNSFRFGFEYIPNRYDVRYYSKRVSYRGGFYYDNSYMKVSGKQINAMGVTLGATLPIFRFYNGLGISLDMGQRGSMKNNLVRERYIMMNFSISLHDIWFIKYKYD